jgi:hypothetical protein
MVTKVGNEDDNKLEGTADDDELSGKNGDDRLFGFELDDLLIGGRHNDILFDGSGIDECRGGSESDTFVAAGDSTSDSFSGSAGSDTMDYRLATNWVQAYLDPDSGAAAGQAVGDTYSSIENVKGSNFGDALQPLSGGFAYGRDGADLIWSIAGGRETLRGDKGVDTIYLNYLGKSGSDVWLQKGKGADILDNFIEGTDRLRIDRSEFDLGFFFTANEVRNNASHTAEGNHAQFIFDTDDFQLWYDGNGEDAGELIKIADFDNSTISGKNLDTGDFITFA